MAAPTLIVGLGGTGSRIVRTVYERATVKQRKDIGFVIIDTDVNDLRMIEESTPQIHTIQTSSRLTVGEYLECDTDSRDTWFPVNDILNAKALTEGAGQVRAVSRLALNTTIQQGKMSPLDVAISDLYKLKGSHTTQAPRVIITGSLCGGTGSGLILPVAMYIRNYLTTRCQQGTSIIRGFFLLPEVYYSVITTETERNNLRSNAYAAIRELDAFMMKADGYLPSKYDVHITVPRPGSKSQEEYTGKPLDFCFLFDAQNINGMQLDSFVDYQQHAANCIYGMAIAPTSARSNSQEDNIIRETVSAGGRNRYAGAGTSLLIYPTEDIKQYLALNWTKETISKEWLEIDKEYKIQKKDSKQRQLSGYPVPDIDRGKHYISVVKTQHSANKFFANAIVNLCVNYDKSGMVENGNKWDEYIEALKNFVEGRIEDRKNEESISDIIGALNSNASAASKPDSEESTFTDWYDGLRKYKGLAIKHTQEMARDIGYSLFKDKNDYTNTDDSFRIENYLHKYGNKDEFIHPNAVRFFLYNVLDKLNDEMTDLREQLKGNIEYWNHFEENAFDIEGTPEKETDINAYAGKHYLGETGISRFLHKSSIEAGRTKLNSFLKQLRDNIDAYWQLYTLNEVYTSAAEYVTRMCNAFEGFYDAIDSSVAGLDRKINDLEEKYVPKEGEALRYVCADKQCLQSLLSDVPNTRTTLELPSQITRQIYICMKNFALADKKPAQEKYFLETFNNTVVKDLGQVIMDEYGSIVDMDIISALEREAVYEKTSSSNIVSREDAELYAKHVIDECKVLAMPFIESPFGREPRIIDSCAYNSCLALSDEAGRKSFINKNLKDFNGVEDDSIDKNMILFFRSVYALRANELSKLAPPKETPTHEFLGGEYYKAYFELISELHPEPQKSKVITPHIDRWWHVITKMPDLDETSEMRQLREIDTAFFWAMIAKYIHREELAKPVYVTEKTELREFNNDENLVTSNGTPCDHLYEVLDAFTVYPKLVKVVNQKVAENIKNDVNNKISLEESFLYLAVKDFYIDEFSIRDKENKRLIRSIFELPLLMKLSIPADIYHEQDIQDLLDTIFAELRLYIRKFKNEKDFSQAYADFIISQFKLYIDNVAIDDTFNKDVIYKDSLFKHICKAVESENREYGIPARKDEIHNLWDNLQD